MPVSVHGGKAHPEEFKNYGQFRASQVRQNTNKPGLSKEALARRALKRYRGSTSPRGTQS